MNTIKEWADFYVGKRLWVYPYRDDNEQFKWLDWRNMKNPDYEEKYTTYDWGTANGINVVTGKKEYSSLDSEDIRDRRVSCS